LLQLQSGNPTATQLSNGETNLPVDTGFVATVETGWTQPVGPDNTLFLCQDTRLYRITFHCAFQHNADDSWNAAVHLLDLTAGGATVPGSSAAIVRTSGDSEGGIELLRTTFIASLVAGHTYQWQIASIDWTGTSTTWTFSVIYLIISPL
jgi:hypothetical protein